MATQDAAMICRSIQNLTREVYLLRQTLAGAMEAAGDKEETAATEAAGGKEAAGATEAAGLFSSRSPLPAQEKT